MATVSADRAASTQPLYDPSPGRLGFEWGVYEIASALSKNDIVEFFRLPTCSVVDGFFRGDDIDTGAEALEIDIGHAAGAEGNVSADPDAFLNSGVITGDAITDLKPAAGIYYPFQGLLPGGPYALTDTSTMVQGVITAAAAGGGTGTLYVGAYVISGLSD